MAHNGHRIQVNPHHLALGMEYPFINHLKVAYEWDYSDNSGKVDRADCDADGYPTQNISSSKAFRCVLNIPSQTDVPGNYVVKWDGTGSVGLFGTLVSGSFSGTNGRAVFTPTVSGPGGANNYLFFIITTDPAPNNVRNVRLCHIDEEALLDSGEIFRPDFLDLMREVGVIRFLDWQKATNNQMTKWSERCPVSYWSYNDDQYPANKLGTLAAYNTATATYTTTVSSFSLAHGEKAIMRWDTTAPHFTISGAASGTGAVIRLTVNSTTNIVTGNSVYIREMGGLTSANNLYKTVTVIDGTHLELQGTTYASGYTSGGYGDVDIKLNINGTGAKSLRWLSGDPPFSASNLGFVTSNAFSSVMYDAALDVFLGHSNFEGSRGIQAGAPPEVMVALCNKVEAHPWFVSPIYALDASQVAPTTANLGDYTSGLAAYVEANLNDGLIPRFEGPNETWNFFGFAQTYYARNRGALRGGSFADNYGMWMSLLGQVISAAYSDDRSRYQVVCGFQTFWGGGPYSFPERVTCPIYVAAGGSSGENWITAICITGYFSPELYATPTEATLAADWLAGDAAQKQAAIDTYNTSCYDNIDRVFTDYYSLYQTFAVSYGFKLTQYEGGYSTNYDSSATINSFRYAAKINGGSIITAVTVHNYQLWEDLGAETEYPSEYVLGGATPWTLWDPDIYVTPTVPRWLAIQQWNALEEGGGEEETPPPEILMPQACM